MINWNTHRLYTAKGQRIAATVVDGKIYFDDIDRMINGVITSPGCTLDQASVMAAYDSHQFQGVCHPIFRDLAKYAALAA